MTKKMIAIALIVLGFVFILFILTAILYAIGAMTELWLLIIAIILLAGGIAGVSWFFYYYSTYVCLKCGKEFKPKQFWSWFFSGIRISRRRLLCPHENKIRMAQHSCYYSAQNEKAENSPKNK